MGLRMKMTHAEYMQLPKYNNPAAPRPHEAPPGTVYEYERLEAGSGTVQHMYAKLEEDDSGHRWLEMLPIEITD